MNSAVRGLFVALALLLTGGIPLQAGEPAANQPRIVIRQDATKPEGFLVNGLQRTETETRDWLTRISLTFGRTDPVIVIADPIKPMEPIVLIYKYAQEHFDRVAFVLLDEASNGFTVMTSSGDEFHQLVRKLLIPKPPSSRPTRLPPSSDPFDAQKRRLDSYETGQLPGAP